MLHVGNDKYVNPVFMIWCSRQVTMPLPNWSSTALVAHTSLNVIPSTPLAQSCTLDGISMNIQEENPAYYFRVRSEREQSRVYRVSFIQNIFLSDLFRLK